MKNKTVLATVLLLLLAGAFSGVWGQPSGSLPSGDDVSRVPGAGDSHHQVNAAVYFRIGESTIDPDFQGNKHRLAIFISALERVLADPDYLVSRMVVVGTASPDGKESVNLALAGRRAQALADYLTSHTSLPSHKIEVVNGGENWNGLRLMMEASEKMPYKKPMLRLMDIAEPSVRKHKMMHYAGSKPWLWMYDHFFDLLRTGSGGTQGRASLSKLSRENWSRTREIVHAASLNDETKRAMLDVIDQETDAAMRITRFKVLCPDTTVYMRLREEIITGLLSEESALSADNWALLREKVAVSGIPGKAAILHIIDNVPVARGREHALQFSDGGESYRQLLDRFLPGLLLVADRPARAERNRPVSPSATLGGENWRRLRDMIAVSEMPGKALVLYLIDNEPDVTEREQQLRTFDDGYCYRYINEIFFPELLYGISPVAHENWAQLSLAVGESGIPRKEQILEIIRTTAPGLEREEAIRALDGGESWRRMGELLLPKLLQGTENVPLTGTGMSFYYELSPRARARAATLSETACLQSVTPAVDSLRPPLQITVSDNPSAPVVALKTDLIFWGGVMPGFRIGAWTPNLSAEFYFARRWSVQAGYAYSDWNALGGSKSLFSLSAANLEVRTWLGEASAFRGVYLAVYGSLGQYDVQDAAQGRTGSFWSAGIGAGWLQPLSNRWAFEAELRGGYRKAQNERYDIEPGHYYFNCKETAAGLFPQLRLQLIYRFGKQGK